MQQLTQGWILEFQLAWYVAKVILCSSCPVLVSKSFRTSILVSDCSCFHGKLRTTFSAVSLPTGLIWTRFGVRRRFKRSAVRVSNRPVFRLFIWTLANVKQPRLKFSWGFTGLDYNKTVQAPGRFQVKPCRWTSWDERWGKWNLIKHIKLVHNNDSRMQSEEHPEFKWMRTAFNRAMLNG